MSPNEAQVHACTLAQEAMQLLREGIGQARSVHHKASGDWFSALDIRIEDHLRQRITETFPSHAFLGEESGATGTNKDFVWVVDPIDGSMNFLRGYPQYSVSIALLERDEPIAACIADPCRGEVFSAALGQGATVNGYPMAVARTVALRHAIAATVFPKPRAPFINAYLARFGNVMNEVAGVRRSGSMALELAYLAAGRVDVFWQRGMDAWDSAAGVLLIREAGGQVFTLDGLHWLESKEVCAATPGLAEAWRALLLAH